MKETVKIIIIFIIISAMVIFIPNLDNSFILADKLYISEILVNNTYTHLDNDNEYSDYIEIYNGYKYKMNLKNYHLSDSEFETKKWTFPDITIEAGEYLIVYASGKDKCDVENKICHTNFKLSSEGETITLTDKTDNIINKFTYSKTTNDISYGYYKGKYSELSYPTPGKPNSKTLKRVNIKEYDIYINEYMSHNTGTNYIDNNYYDWIEIYNNSNKDLELNNIYLSDTEDDLTKYKLPDTLISSKDYKIIYLSGISKYEEDIVYANFKLTDNEYIIISNGKKIIDKVEIVSLPDNISYGRKDDKWYYFTKPTPGSINDTITHTSLGGTNERS